MPDDSDLTMLRHDAVSELDAINLYQAHLDSIKDEETRRVIAGIREDEKEHLAEIIGALKRLDPEQADAFRRFSPQVMASVSGTDIQAQLAEIDAHIAALDKALAESVFPEPLPPTISEPTRTFRRVTPWEFQEARSKASRPQFLTPYAQEDLATMRLYLSPDGLTGYAIKSDGDLVNVFNIGVRGGGEDAVVDAIKRGAETLDCFAPFLPQYYSRFGFKAYEAMSWDDQYAPPDWDYQTYGRPDVVLMRYEGGDRNSIKQRIGTFEGFAHPAINERAFTPAFLEGQRAYIAALEGRDVRPQARQITLYHGTNEDFPDSEISIGKRMYGIHLTTDPEAAKLYGKVKTYTLSPDASTLDLSDPDQTWQFMVREGILDKEDQADVDLQRYVEEGRLFQYDISSRTHYADDVAKTVQYLGYDLVMLPDDLGGLGENIAWVVVNPRVLIPDSATKGYALPVAEGFITPEGAFEELSGYTHYGRAKQILSDQGIFSEHPLYTLLNRGWIRFTSGFGVYYFHFGQDTRPTRAQQDEVHRLIDQGAPEKVAYEVSNSTGHGVTWGEGDDNLDRFMATGYQVDMVAPAIRPAVALGRQSWIEPSGELISAPWGHEEMAQTILRNRNALSADETASTQLLNQGWVRVYIGFGSYYFQFGERKPTRRQAEEIDRLIDEGEPQGVTYEVSDSQGRTLIWGDGDDLDRFMETGYHVGAGARADARPEKIIPVTPGARIELGYAGIREGFSISTPSGAKVSGYLNNQDFPNQGSKATRGEIFYVWVPKQEQGRGIGTSLVYDALRLMQANGSETYNSSLTSEAGRRLHEAIIAKGYIDGTPIQTSETGKAEYLITVGPRAKLRANPIYDDMSDEEITDLADNTMRLPEMADARRAIQTRANERQNRGAWSNPFGDFPDRLLSEMLLLHTYELAYQANEPLPMSDARRREIIDDLARYYAWRETKGKAYASTRADTSPFELSREEWLAASRDFQAAITEDQRYQIKRYVGTLAQSVNDWLRGKWDAPEWYVDDFEDAIKAIDAGLARFSLDRDIIVYRNVRDDLFPTGSFTDPAYVSASYEGRWLGSGKNMRIIVPAGTGLAPVGTISGLTSEGEILLPRGLTFVQVDENTWRAEDGADARPEIGISPARPDGATVGDDLHYYHGTNRDNAYDIFASGAMVTHKPSFGTDQRAWPDGSTEKRSYFVPDASQAWQFTPEGSQPVILRVRRDTISFKREGTGDYYTTSKIPATSLEMLAADGTWHPLGDFFARADARPSVPAELDQLYPRAGATVDGRTVGTEIPNTSSLDASFTRYEELPGVRAVPMRLFNTEPPTFRSTSEEKRTRELAERIRASGRVDPLIVVIDSEGPTNPYILEGGHRFDALKLIGASAFPGLVVLDQDA